MKDLRESFTWAATAGFGSLAALAVLMAMPGASAQAPLEEHPPIVIRSDADFEGLWSGVRSGDGTAANPYIISGWIITNDHPWTLWEGTESAAITITDTTSHFVIEDITFGEGFSEWGGFNGNSFSTHIDLFGNANATVRNFATFPEGPIMDVRENQAVVLENMDFNNTALYLLANTNVHLRGITMRREEGPTLLYIRDAAKVTVTDLNVAGRGAGIDVFASGSVILSLAEQDSDAAPPILLDIRSSERFELKGTSTHPAILADVSIGGVDSIVMEHVHIAGGELQVGTAERLETRSITVDGGEGLHVLWVGSWIGSDIEVTGSNGKGITAHNVTTLRLSDVTARNNRLEGISIELATDAGLEDVVVEANGAEGLQSYAVDKLTVERMLSVRNGGAGFRAYHLDGVSSSVVVRDAMFSRNEGAIDVRDVEAAVMERFEVDDDGVITAHFLDVGSLELSDGVFLKTGTWAMSMQRVGSANLTGIDLNVGHFPIDPGLVGWQGVQGRHWGSVAFRDVSIIGGVEVSVAARDVGRFWASNLTIQNGLGRGIDLFELREAMCLVDSRVVTELGPSIRAEAAVGAEPKGTLVASDVRASKGIPVAGRNMTITQNGEGSCQMPMGGATSSRAPPKEESPAWGLPLATLAVALARWRRR
jgi:hypothetical protein